MEVREGAPRAPDGTHDRHIHPVFDDMTISISRHENYFEDTTFTYQFPLSALNTQDIRAHTLNQWLGQSAFDMLSSYIEGSLHIPLTDMSIVWCLSESGQLAVINDRCGLIAAIMNHQNAGRSTVHLYVVKNYGEIVCRSS
ncbi:unnamed protein product [Aureobasidium vineae]|uniref:Uncharacterized protein n=1 Tax=Aureobasidium vineae TaxID=2773715 RepID=A0A9N8P6M4_9PEZI|nr:unnamed protein product [Aureobasidium vineae]